MSPSPAVHSILQPHKPATASAYALPDRTPPLRYSMTPPARIPGDIVRALVRSSRPSSARAAAAMRSISRLEDKGGAYPRATMRSMAPRARLAMSGGTVT